MTGRRRSARSSAKLRSCSLKPRASTPLGPSVGISEREITSPLTLSSAWGRISQRTTSSGPAIWASQTADPGWRQLATTRATSPDANEISTSACSSVTWPSPPCTVARSDRAAPAWTASASINASATGWAPRSNKAPPPQFSVADSPQVGMPCNARTSTDRAAGIRRAWRNMATTTGACARFSP